MRNLFIEIWFTNKSMQVQYGRDLLFISRLYSRFISDVKIDNLRKISIEIIESPDKAHIIPTHKLTKVCVLNKHLDLSVLSEIKQETTLHEFFLDFVLESMMELSEKFHWPKEKFKEAYNKVIESKFKNEFVLLSQKHSNDKRYGASIIVNSNKEYVLIILELNDKKQCDETRRIELAKIVYNKDEFSNIVHKLKWVSNGELIVSNKDEEINFKFSVQNEIPEMFLTPKMHNEKYLQDELKLLNPSTSKEECLEINNKRIANLSSMQEE
jgi:hypothetical protein